MKHKLALIIDFVKKNYSSISFSSWIYFYSALIFIIAIIISSILFYKINLIEGEIIQIHHLSGDVQKMHTFIGRDLFNDAQLLTIDTVMQRIKNSFRELTLDDHLTTDAEKTIINKLHMASESYSKIVIKILKNYRSLQDIRIHIVNLKKRLNSLLFAYINARGSDQLTSAERITFNNHIAKIEQLNRLIIIRLDHENYDNHAYYSDLQTLHERDVAELTQVLTSMQYFVESPIIAKIEPLIIPSIPEIFLDSDENHILNYYRNMSNQIDAVKENIGYIYSLNQLIHSVEEQSKVLLHAIENVTLVLERKQENTFFYQTLSLLLWLIVFSSIVTSFFIYSEKLRNKNIDIKLKSDKLTKSVLILLTEISEYTTGNISKDVTVSSAMTGSIADSINMVIQSMRNLIRSIKKNAYQVSIYVDTNLALNKEIRASTQSQVKTVRKSSEELVELSKVYNSLSHHAHEVADKVKQSQEINTQNIQRLEESTKSIDIIRSDIQQTSRKLKHLAESSQRIGEIVEFLSDISEQTKLVAANASIQVSSNSGGNNYGIISMVDQTQKVATLVGDNAQQATEIAIHIERDTVKTIKSMEDCIAKVVKEHTKNQEAKKSLENLTKSYSYFLTEIDFIIQEVATNANIIKRQTEGMGEISEATDSIHSKMNRIDENISFLSQRVSDLLESISAFMLPEEDES